MASSPRTVPVAFLYERMEELEQRVLDLARRFARERGTQEGVGVDDLFRAEAELRATPTALCERLEGAFAIRVELPGIALEDVELGLERNEMVLAIRGRKTAFLTIDLPPGLDPSKAAASLTGGVLTVTVPRRREARTPESAKRPA
jgi:HSP20 family molecular chaperone IbpA